MNTYTIQTLEIWFRDAITKETERLADFSLRTNRPVQYLIEDEAIQGTFEYRVTYTDGTVQVVEHDIKEVEDRHYYRPTLLAFAERYKDIMEWRSGQDFRTKRLIERNSVGDRSAYGRLHDMEFVMESLLEDDLENRLELIEDGYYVDNLLERWIDVEASRQALTPLILNLVYFEGLKANSHIIQQIDVTFEDARTGLHAPLTEYLSTYRASVYFYEDTSVEGMIHFHINYDDGSEQTITSDKNDGFDDRNATFVGCFLHYWQVMYEYDQKRDFWTNEPFLCYSSYYDYAITSFTTEDWDMVGGKSREAVEARFGKDKYDESQSPDEQFLLTHDFDAAGVIAELQDGLYFDHLLERWVNVKDSYKAVRQLALELMNQ